MSINSLCLVPQASWPWGRVSECVFWRIYMPSVSSGFNNNISPLCERRDPHGVGWIVSNFLSPSVLNFCLNQGQGKWDKEAKSCDHLGVIRWRKLPYLACEDRWQGYTIFTGKIQHCDCLGQKKNCRWWRKKTCSLYGPGTLIGIDFHPEPAEK